MLLYNHDVIGDVFYFIPSFHFIILLYLNLNLFKFI